MPFLVTVGQCEQQTPVICFCSLDGNMGFLFPKGEDDDIVYTDVLQGARITQFHSKETDLFVGTSQGTVTIFDIKKKDSINSKRILELDSKVVQISTLGSLTLVSTETRSIVCNSQNKSFREVGSKSRQGRYGAGFAHCSIICSRPGSRLWIASYEGFVEKTLQFKPCLTATEPFKTIESDCPDVASSTQTIHAFGKIIPIHGRLILTYSIHNIYLINLDIPNEIEWILHKDKLTDVQVHGEQLWILSRGRLSCFDFQTEFEVDPSPITISDVSAIASDNDVPDTREESSQRDPPRQVLHPRASKFLQGSLRASRQISISDDNISKSVGQNVDLPELGYLDLFNEAAANTRTLAESKLRLHLNGPWLENTLKRFPIIDHEMVRSSFDNDDRLKVKRLGTQMQELAEFLLSYDEETLNLDSDFIARSEEMRQIYREISDIASNLNGNYSRDWKHVPEEHVQEVIEFMAKNEFTHFMSCLEDFAPCISMSRLLDVLPPKDEEAWNFVVAYNLDEMRKRFSQIHLSKRSEEVFALVQDELMIPKGPSSEKRLKLLQYLSLTGQVSIHLFGLVYSNGPVALLKFYDLIYLYGFLTDTEKDHELSTLFVGIISDKIEEMEETDAIRQFFAQYQQRDKYLNLLKELFQKHCHSSNLSSLGHALLELELDLNEKLAFCKKAKFKTGYIKTLSNMSMEQRWNELEFLFTQEDVKLLTYLGLTSCYHNCSRVIDFKLSNEAMPISWDDIGLEIIKCLGVRQGKKLLMTKSNRMGKGTFSAGFYRRMLNTELQDYDQDCK
ncbi:hypothetical protein TCAL_16283 [Tigriopus californicus]|uniref:Uncharacterized protein n=2 Tax=Tigriopus californicus TaxID=6832 RepID=A0A553N6B0_TIGCA|nr:hypothetical protein TCAL_16283 [Tigriopus californicus]